MLVRSLRARDRQTSHRAVSLHLKSTMAGVAALVLTGGLEAIVATGAAAAEPVMVEKSDVPRTQLSQEDVKKLADMVKRQNEQLDAQNQRIKELERQVRSRNDVRPNGYSAYGIRPFSSQRAERPQDSSYQRAQNQPVGKPDTKPKPREVEGISDFTGVLAQPGQFIFTPSVEYSQSNINRFSFSGLEVADTVLIGQIEATDSDRDTIVARAGLRFGITNRMEGEVKVPYVYRDDRVTNLIVSDDEETTTEPDGHGLGDVEASLRYQINQGRMGWPIFIAGVRVKSDTGEGPFDVSRDSDGIEQDLPTGSGFWAVEPGITALFGSDPAVFFANLKYTWSLKRDIDKMVGPSMIGEVDPGDNVGISFGIGIGLNEVTSLSFAYEHNFIDGTKTEIDGVDVESNSLDVGSLAIGVSYTLSQAVSLAFSLQAGVTEDAPDVVWTVRVPISF